MVFLADLVAMTTAVGNELRGAERPIIFAPVRQLGAILPLRMALGARVRGGRA